jgi:hypothetical protein
MAVHIKVLGWLHFLVGGAACAGSALFAFLFLGMGALGGLAEFVEGDVEGAVAAFGLLGFVGVLIGGCTALAALPGMIAGLGLLAGSRWAPILAVVVSLLHVLNVPFGTALAVYTFWVCLSKEGQAELGFKVA